MICGVCNNMVSQQNLSQQNLSIQILDSYNKDNLCDYYEILQAQKRLQCFLYQDQSLENFISLFYKQWIYIPYLGDKPVGFTAFNDFIGKNAFFHFCMFKGFETYTVQFGKMIFQTVFENADLENILGLTPARYYHVFPIILGVGMKQITRLEKACLVHNKWQDGIISQVNRDYFMREVLYENL